MSSRGSTFVGACLIAALLAAYGAPEASSLDTLFARGDSSIAVIWTPDSANTRAAWYETYGTGCTGEDSVYRHCDFLPGQTYQSIAYSYGGEDGYLRFRDKIADGFLVGSHMCHYNNYGDPSPVVAGTDCSGFICYLLEAPRVSTREIYSQYTAINRDELDVGDILVKSGSHAVIIVEKEDATNFLIWESTSVVNGCRERAIDITDTYWDAYFPRRYQGLNSRTVPAARKAVPSRRPRVSVHGNRCLLSAPFAWNGVFSLFTLQGQSVGTSPISISNEESVTITLPRATGSFIARFVAADQSTFTVPISAIAR